MHGIIGEIAGFKFMIKTNSFDDAERIINNYFSVQTGIENFRHVDLDKWKSIRKENTHKLIRNHLKKN